MLGILAAAFVTMTQLERRASRQRLYATKALLLARSGIEDALARLSAGQAATYGGEDWDGNGVLTRGPEEAGSQVYQPGKLDTDACPVRHALRPSFFASLGLNPKTALVDVRHRGYSGLLSGDCRGDGNQMALQVKDGGFYVNGGDPAALPTAGYNAVLRRMLGTLAEALDREDGTDDGIPVDEADGQALMSTRPPAGWQSWDEIRNRAFLGNQAKLEALQPYLTLHAWVDKHVITPNASQSELGRRYPSWGELRLDRPLNPSDPSRRSPDFERIGSKIVGRAPVSLAWARTRRPALIALLADLQGSYLASYGVGVSLNLSLPKSGIEETAAGYIGIPYPGMDSIGIVTATGLTNLWMNRDQCHIAADAILISTSALATWQQWDDLCDSIPFTATTGTGTKYPALCTQELREALSSILKANFNPNSDLNKFNPNRFMWRESDKSDLLAYSTEFSLVPVQGQEVESVGRVLDSQGRLLALRVVSASLAAPSVVRLSTQKEFVCSNLGDLDRAGDETGPRLPGDTSYLSLSQGTGGTWGESRAALGNAGIGLQAYPEPYVATGGSGGALSINPADYDGCLQLATVETRLNDWYNVTTPTRDMGLLARFDDGFDLDVHHDTAQGLNQTDVAQVATGGELANSLWDAAKPNTLYPDGGYSEKDRCPTYFDKDNSDGLHELLSFWVKGSGRQNALGLSGRGHVFVERTNFSMEKMDADSLNQCFILGLLPRATFQPIWACHFEVTHATNTMTDNYMPVDGDLQHEWQFGIPRTGEAFPFPDFGNQQRARWRLVTFAWDFEANRGHDTGEFILNGGDAAANEVASDSNYYLNDDLRNDPTTASDITQPDWHGAHRMRLGPQPSGRFKMIDACTGNGADATLDEFALYDFGPGCGRPSGPASTFASTRYQEGRYYKEAGYRAPGRPPLGSPPGEAGSWVSAPILFPQDVHIKKVAWTWQRPNELPDDYPEVEFLDAMGTGYLWPSGNRSGRRDNQAWGLNQKVSGPFRMRVVFERATPVPASTPILECPVFDDLSILYEPSTGPRVLAWE
jgi:hypothetical protein